MHYNIVVISAMHLYESVIIHDIVQERGIKTIPMKKKCKKSKMALWGGLTNSYEKKRGEKQRRKGNI